MDREIESGIPEWYLHFIVNVCESALSSITFSGYLASRLNRSNQSHNSHLRYLKSNTKTSAEEAETRHTTLPLFIQHHNRPTTIQRVTAKSSSKLLSLPMFVETANRPFQFNAKHQSHFQRSFLSANRELLSFLTTTSRLIIPEASMALAQGYISSKNN